mgnify:CR=1 FL=1
MSLSSSPQSQPPKTYDNTSISALKGADRVRLRPGVIFGSNDLQGCFHGFFEILSNSIDEAREGYGKHIIVRRYQDHSISVEDFGRGIPLAYNRKEKRYNWELVYCELYAGAKYANDAQSEYEFSLGLNGLGACATQYASSWFKVEVRRDNKLFQLDFVRGENVSGLQQRDLRPEEKAEKPTGTLQHWLPDLEVFTEIEIPLEYFQEILTQQSVVNPGIRFDLYDEATGETWSYETSRGIAERVEELAGQDAITGLITNAGTGMGRDRKDLKDYHVKAEVAFCFTQNTLSQEYFHNSSFLAYGGAPERAAKAAFLGAIDRELQKRGKYKAQEEKIKVQDVFDSLVLISSSFSNYVSYENQTKKAINNRFIREYLTELLEKALELWFVEDLAGSEKALDQILVNKRSRESSDRQRINLKKKLSVGTGGFLNRVPNFVDCKSKVQAERELFIVEGNSALGSVKMARNADFQAVIPLRGKILNCLKANYRQIFSNQIIVDLLKVLGCGAELHGNRVKDLSNFDLDKLRWGKIIICTDADVDGFQIRTLILAMLYRLTPKLLTEGLVYIAESPLFEVTFIGTGRGKKGEDRGEETYFAYSETEKRALLKTLARRKGTVKVQRSKGLGENEPEMMWTSTMNPKTRRLIQVLPEEPAKMKEYFDLLLGDNLSGRKAYIESHGAKYMDMIDTQ